MDRLYTVRGIEATRGFYEQEAYTPPFIKGLHLKMLEFEGMETKSNVGKIRKIYEVVTHQFGESDVGKF